MFQVFKFWWETRPFSTSVEKAFFFMGCFLFFFSLASTLEAVSSRPVELYMISKPLSIGGIAVTAWALTVMSFWFGMPLHAIDRLRTIKKFHERFGILPTANSIVALVIQKLVDRRMAAYAEGREEAYKVKDRVQAERHWLVEASAVPDANLFTIIRQLEEWEVEMAGVLKQKKEAENSYAELEQLVTSNHLPIPFAVRRYYKEYLTQGGEAPPPAEATPAMDESGTAVAEPVAT